MNNPLKFLFRAPTLRELVAAESEEARRQLLQWQTSAEYAQSMVEYNTKRIARLENTALV